MDKGLTFHRWMGGSGEIRGEQVGDFLGVSVRMMPSRPNGGINVWVKGQPVDDYPRGRSYLDMMDAGERVPWIRQHPDIGLIGISRTAIKWMQRKIGRDDIHLIPEHHCNYRRERRQRDQIRRVGVIGNRNAFWGITPEIVRTFAAMGLEFVYQVNPDGVRKYHGNPFQPTVYVGQEGVRNFYRNLDIQVVWRPHLHSGSHMLCNPLKLENAGSFGIPTVAYPEPSYAAEWDKCFVPVQTMQEMFAAVKRLRDDRDYYRDMSERARERAEQYHIEHTSRKYLCLT